MISRDQAQEGDLDQVPTRCCAQARDEPCTPGILPAMDIEPTAPLTEVNIFISALFLLTSCALSLGLGLDMAGDLFVAGLRSLVQLSVLGMIIDRIFAINTVYAVLGLSILLSLLGAFEATYNKSRSRFDYMFPLTFVILFFSAGLTAVLGSQFGLNARPFWTASRFIPILGLLLGNVVSGCAIGSNYVLKQFQEDRDKIEILLAFGASRWEVGAGQGYETTHE